MSGALQMIPAGVPHLALLAALHRECFADSWSVESFGELLGTGATGWLAVASEQPVGLLLTRLAAGEGEILTIGVLPAARRRGVARRLLEHGLAAAGEQGCRMIFLEVGAGNEAARALYRAAGFHEVGRRPGYYRLGDGATEDAVIMRRDY